MTITFRATAKNGELSWGSDYNRARLADYLKGQEGKQFILTRLDPKRSLPQNNYYWFYLGIIEQETGNNAEDLHEFFKRALLPRKTITIRGKESEHKITIPKSTTELTKLKFTEYLDKICAMTSIPLPDPVEAGYISNI